MSIALWIALGSCIAVCYFSACNIALKRYSRSRLADLLEERGQSEELDWLTRHADAYVLMTGMVRTGLNLTVLLVVLFELDANVNGLAPWEVYLFSFAIAVVLVTVFAVAIPTSWANYHAERLIVLSLPVLHVFHVVLKPIVWVLHLFDPIVRRITGVDLTQQQESEISDEVLTVVEDRDRAGDIDDAQKQMLEAVFDLPNTDVGEIMTPRTDVNGIEVHATLDQVKQQAVGYGHSRIPVYEEDLDHIVGILYVKDLIQFVGDGETFDLRGVLREPFLVPESKKVHELLAEFKARKVHMALVLDEYGGTAGLVTIEDVLEEIVGEIHDEYEHTEVDPGIERGDAGEIEVDARVRIDDLNDELDIELPEDEDYDTVGGFVSSALGHIPEVGETFDAHGCRFTVTEAERTRVAKVRVEKLETESTPAD